MNYKFLILLLGSFLLAFSVNLMPALKHPDSNMNIFNLLVTLLFMLLLAIYSKKGNKLLILFSTVGVISGIFVFVIATFEPAMIGNGILDLIVSIQYPFYIIFTTPVFGSNMLLDFSYGGYSLLMSLFYGIVLALTIYFKKNYTQSA